MLKKLLPLIFILSFLIPSLVFSQGVSITNLPELSTGPASGDVLPIVDISEPSAANKTKKITVEHLFEYNSDLSSIIGGTWTGSSSITQLGTITSGIWNGTAIGVTYGGTGLSSLGTANQLLGVNATPNAIEYKTLNGTINQITVTHSMGGITLSLPQDFATTSGPTLGHLHLSDLAAITTASESWIGPSSTTGLYFKGGTYGFGTATPNPTKHITITKSGADDYVLINSDAGYAAGIDFQKGGSQKWGIAVKANSNDLTFTDKDSDTITFEDGGTVVSNDLKTKGPELDSRTYATIELADAAATAAGKTLLVTQNYTLTANTTLTSHVKIVKGGSFTKASTYTLTFSSGFENPSNSQCFIGFAAGNVTGLREAWPEWWGPNTTPGTTDMTVEIQSAIDSMTKGPVHFLPYIYLISTIELNDNIGLWGSGKNATIIKSNVSGTTAAIRKKTGETVISKASIKDLTIYGTDGNGGFGLHLDSFNEFYLENVEIDMFRNAVDQGKGLYLTNDTEGCAYNRFVGLTIANCDTALEMDSTNATYATGYNNFVGLVIYQEVNSISLKRTNDHGSIYNTFYGIKLQGNNGAGTYIYIEGSGNILDGIVLDSPGAGNHLVFQKTDTAGNMVRWLSGFDATKYVNNQTSGALNTLQVMSWMTGGPGKPFTISDPLGEVQFNFLAGGTNQGATFAFGNDASSIQWRWIMQAAASPVLSLYYGASVSTVWDRSGQMGVGMAPAARLHLAGTYADEGADRIPATVQKLSAITSGAGDGATYFKTGWDNTANEGIFTIAVGTSSGGVVDALTLRNGKAGVNTATPARTLESFHATLPQLRLTQADGTAYAEFQATTTELDITHTNKIIRFKAADASTLGGYFSGSYARGTLASPTVVGDDDTVFAIEGLGYDSNSYETVGRIRFEVDGTPGNGDMPGRIVFDTTPDGSATAQTRMTISSTGNVSIPVSITTPSIIATSNSLTIKPTTDATTAIQIQDKDGNVILNVDTTNNYVGVGGATTLAANLHLSGTYASESADRAAATVQKLSVITSGAGDGATYFKTGWDNTANAGIFTIGVGAWPEGVMDALTLKHGNVILASGGHLTANWTGDAAFTTSFLKTWSGYTGSYPSTPDGWTTTYTPFLFKSQTSTDRTGGSASTEEAGLSVLGQFSNVNYEATYNHSVQGIHVESAGKWNAGGSVPVTTFGDITSIYANSFGKTWAGNDDCTASETPYTCCTGENTGTCGGARNVALLYGTATQYGTGGATGLEIMATRPATASAGGVTAGQFLAADLKTADNAVALNISTDGTGTTGLRGYAGLYFGASTNGWKYGIDFNGVAFSTAAISFPDGSIQNSGYPVKVVKCTGSNDHTAINAAITAATKGTVVHLTGSCVITDTINLTDVSLEGDGLGTVITGSGLGATEDAIYATTTDYNLYKIVIRNLYVYMNGGGRDGIRLVQGDYPTIENVYIYKPGQDGVHAEPVSAGAYLENLRYDNVKVIDAVRYGFSFINPNVNGSFINLGTFTNIEGRGGADTKVYIAILTTGTNVGQISNLTFIGSEFNVNGSSNKPGVLFVGGTGTGCGGSPCKTTETTFIGTTIEAIPTAQTNYAISGSAANAASTVHIINCILYNYSSGDFDTNITLSRLTSAAYEIGVIKVGGTSTRGTTEGTNHIDIFDGTAPVGTLTNGGSIYSTSGELWTMDSGGNATQQTPHDEKGEWIFYSKNTVTGKVLRINMEQLMRKLDDMLGGGFIEEFIDSTN